MNTSELSISVELTLSQWRKTEQRALKLIKLVGKLRFDRGIDLVLFREDIYDTRSSEVINRHKFANNYSDQEITVDLSVEIAEWLVKNESILPARIDIGILGVDFLKSSFNRIELNDFLGEAMARFHGDDQSDMQSKDVILYGFGRIGRLLARRIITSTGRGDQLRLKAIVIRPKMKNVKEELEKRAALLRHDSIHGEFHGTIEVNDEEGSMTINGNKIKVIFAKSPTDIDYTAYGINDALVIDNTGVWRDKEALSVHLRPGVSQVLLTAPGGGIPNIVYGSNHKEADADGINIISAASCTTNAIVPVISVLDSKFGIEDGHIETIHAYTSDQNLLDNFHKKARRGRGAAVNMVLTNTGAAKAVSKVLPHLAGCLTGNAVRVPTPDVSIAILNLTLSKATTVEEINALLKEASLHGDLVEQVHYSNSTEFVSSNAIGTTSTSIIDAPSTLISKDGKRATVYVWYDNEFGYCCQVVRLAKHFAQVRRLRYY